MQTYRADIDAANDNKTRRKKRWVLSVSLCLLIVGFIGYIEGKRYLFSGLPELPTKASMWKMNVQPNMTLLDKDGVIIGHRGPYYGRPLTLNELPRHVSDAFLAIEDQRFYEHPGIDRKAILRAFLENAKAGRKVQGGSTLTQQLVKNMVLSPKKTYKRKFQEMWLSYKMEQALTKPEILELYLNRIDLGNRSYGVEAAAQRYFQKSALDLTIAESAVLAALPKAPTAYDPIKHPKASTKRAKLILNEMMFQGKISSTEMSEAENNMETTVSHADPYLEGNILGHVFDMVAEKVPGLIGSKTQDLIVQTTIDPKLQKLAHHAITKTITPNKKRKHVSEGAMVSLDNRTGAVRALIGGTNYIESKFNRASQALRQPGSSFKAFVYATALEEGFSPGTVRIDEPVNIAGWQPENYTSRYRGPMTIREALRLSINTVAAQVGAEIGPHKIVELAHRFGIKSKLGAHYSIALGAAEVHLIDLTSAYMVFANEGIKQTPYLIETITDTANTEIYRHKSSEAERVYAAPYARQMSSMLQDVIDTGTGHGARLGKRQAAGKTGTSQDYRDAWFIGYTAQLTTGVWLGNDDNSPTKRITGGLLPVDAWKAFMVGAHKGKKRIALPHQKNILANEKAKTLQAFYQNLGESLIRERNLASGIKPTQEKTSN